MANNVGFSMNGIASSPTVSAIGVSQCDLIIGSTISFGNKYLGLLGSFSIYEEPDPSEFE